MTHKLYEIWEEILDHGPNSFPWRAQLWGYVGRFPSRAKAEAFVAAVKKDREKAGLPPE